MEIELSKEDKDFEREVREFVSSKLPPDVATKVLEHRELEKDDISRWHSALYTKGWVAQSSAALQIVHNTSGR